MSIENKIDSRERMVEEIADSTHFSSTRARRLFTMRDTGDLMGRGVDNAWLVCAEYGGKLVYEQFGFDNAHEYEASWDKYPEYTGGGEQDRATWLAYIEARMPHDHWWLLREAYRFINGNYTPAVLVSQLYRLADSNRDLENRVRSLWWHFPHISLDEPSMVAYTPNPEYGVRDRQVRTKVGRYLQQFYGNLLTSEQIRSMANGTKQLDLEFESDIRAGYMRAGRDGVTSCMTHSVSNYETCGDYHPVDVYQTGDFKVALLNDGFSNEICARALVHESSRVFVRAYGREYNTLVDRLMDEGYSEQSHWDEGTRLLLIRDDDNNVVVPYMDGGIQSASIEWHDGKEWLVVDSGGDVDLSTTSGVWYERETRYCDACEDSVDANDEDMSYSSYHGMTIGPCCIDDYCTAYVSRRSRDLVREDMTVECACDGERYVEENLDEFGIVYCEATDDYRFTDNLVTDVRGDDIPTENAHELANTVNSGETAYVYEGDLERLFQIVIERIDGDCRMWLHNRDLVDEDEDYEAFVQRYENARTVVDDFGNVVKPDYMTLMELTHYFGVDHGCTLFRRHTGIWVNEYVVGRRLNAMQQRAA